MQADGMADKYAIQVELNEASCSTVPLVTDEVSTNHAASTTTSILFKDSKCPNGTGCDIALDSGNRIVDTGFDNSLHSEALPVKDDYNVSNNFTSRPAKFSFSNKKHPNNNLCMSSEDYEKLLLGKNLQFFHPRSLSSLRVRPLISTNSISKGTPREEITREVAVPIPYPLPEEGHHYLHLGSESDVLGHEEAVSHIVKKKRVLSGSSMVTKVSTIQFQFGALKENSSMKCRKVERSIRHGRVVGSGAISRKRSLVHVDKLPFFAGTHRQNAVVSVKRTKRKEADLLLFEEYYHPPFKKCRISVSASVACNFSLVSSLSSSLGVSNSLMFVL